MMVSAMTLPVHDPADPLDDPIHRGDREIFEMVGGRQRDMRRGDADDRPVEIPERFVRDDRRDLGAPAAQAGIFLDGEEPAVLATEPRMVRVSSGTSERRSTTSALMPWSRSRIAAASSERGTIIASATMVQSLPALRIFAVPRVSMISPSGTSPLVA